MKSKTTYASVWDALEDDPIKVENLKMRSELMIAINNKIAKDKLNQSDAAKYLAISQPRISALSQGKIDAFRLNTLVNFAHRLGLHVSINIAA
jgi:predicted XRE-type DNA-binding protein